VPGECQRSLPPPPAADIAIHRDLLASAVPIWEQIWVQIAAELPEISAIQCNGRNGSQALNCRNGTRRTQQTAEGTAHNAEAEPRAPGVLSAAADAKKLAIAWEHFWEQNSVKPPQIGATECNRPDTQPA
jgi:hypothetical protein